MSVIHELRNQASLAAQAFDAGDYDKCRVLLEQMQIGRVNGSEDPRSLNSRLMDLSATVNRHAVSAQLLAAVVVATPREGEKGGFSLHIAGHPAVKHLIENKFQLARMFADAQVAKKDLPKAPELDADGNPVAPPVDELAAKRAELEKQKALDPIAEARQADAEMDLPEQPPNP